MTICGIKDNAQHVAGLFIGLINRLTGRRYNNDERGTRWFSTVAANVMANGDAFEFFPYR